MAFNHMKSLPKKDQARTIYFLGNTYMSLKDAIEEQDWDKVEKIQSDCEKRYRKLVEQTKCW